MEGWKWSDYFVERTIHHVRYGYRRICFRSRTCCHCTGVRAITSIEQRHTTCPQHDNFFKKYECSQHISQTVQDGNRSQVRLR